MPDFSKDLLLRCLCGGLDTCAGSCRAGAVISNTKRKFAPHKVYRRDDRGIVGVESFGLQGLAFVVIHIVLDALR